MIEVSRRVHLGWTGASVLVLTASIGICTPTVHAAIVTPPAATLHVVNASGNAGNWYSGALPSSGGTNLPVLVFVQGLHSNASQWFSDGMYQYAYNAGYRTAFVQLADADGTGGSIQQNGGILAQQLQSIGRFYGVAKVDIIAHSKGGNDVQAAIAYDGANRYINEVFELSTPNYGSQLADLSYSWWAGWLASLLGQRDAAVYDLQTSRMTSFRNQEDNTLGGSNVDFYTTAGTNHGPWFSSLWYGGLYLDAYGRNDGAVTVESAHLPAWYSFHAWTDNPMNSSITYNHNSIHQAANTWQFIQPWLVSIYNNTNQPSAIRSVGSNAADASASARGTKRWTAPSVIYRGGAFGGNSGSKTETFTVDPTTGTLTLAVLTAHETASMTLTGPNGKPVPVSATTRAADGVFAGAYTHDFVVTHPQPGAYQLRLTEPLSDGYLMLCELQGTAAPQVMTQTTDVHPGVSVPLSIRIPGASHHPSSNGLLQVSRVTPTASSVISSQPVLSNSVSNDTWYTNLTAPSQPGVYNVSITLPALVNGKSVERSITYSVTVDG